VPLVTKAIANGVEVWNQSTDGSFAYILE
jgi:hypothetical protein